MKHRQNKRRYREREEKKKKMASNSREERRKRIVDRGSDRLALITGQVQSIPASPPPPPPPSRLAPSYSIIEDGYRHPLLAKQSNPKGATKAKDETSSSSTSVSPKKPAEAANNEAIISPLASTEIGSRSATPPPSSSSTNSETPQPQNPNKNLLDPRLITSAIASTERVRLLCSTTAGFLVVLSYTGFPLLGSSIFRTVLIVRPLYLLLLTNASVVVAKLMLSKTVKPGKAGNDNNDHANENGVDWVNHVGSSLEMGYLMMKVMDAVMMDCGLYAIVVVCFISLLQMLF